MLIDATKQCFQICKSEEALGVESHCYTIEMGDNEEDTLNAKRRKRSADALNVERGDPFIVASRFA